MDPTRIANMFGMEPATWDQDTEKEVCSNLSRTLPMWSETEVKLLRDFYVTKMRTTLKEGDKVKLAIQPDGLKLKHGMCVLPNEDEVVEGRDFEFLE